MLYPFKFKPIFKEKIWGGQKLKTILNKEIPEDTPIGESWEISDHDVDTNIISNGSFAGKNLHYIFTKFKKELLGNRLATQYSEKFPLLFKFIDGSGKLSIQVHPNNEYAQKHEKDAFGKTEAWYIVHAEPDSYIIAGLSKKTTKEEFAQAIENNALEPYFNKIYVKSGDFIYIPSGRLHAIMPGILLNEIQQNSDITYRVYDWNRPGLDGKPRTLHIQQSLDTINFKDIKIDKEIPSPINDYTQLLKKSPFFTVEKLNLTKTVTESTTISDSFHGLSMLEGRANIKTKKNNLKIEKGNSILIPHSVGEYTIVPEDTCLLLKSYIGRT